MAEAVRRTKKEGLEQAKGDLEKLISEKRCHPILIRFCLQSLCRNFFRLLVGVN